MIYSCEDHINEALEESLTDQGLPPELEEIPPEVRTSKKCFLCQDQAVYQIKIQTP